MKSIDLRSRAARRALAVIVAATAALAGTVVADAAKPHAQPVLGSKRFIANPNARGYGEFAPERIFNDGDPGGAIDDIAWRRWGRHVATGEGTGSVAKPGGGWIGGQRFQLRASHLGRCMAGGPLAYRRLEVRWPVGPDAHLGRWRLWMGARDLCRPMS
jgi:hypothetical protein